MNAVLQRLRAEVRTDLAVFGEQVRELEALILSSKDADRGDLARAAVALHHGYGAVEALLLRVCRTFEGEEPTGSAWHRDLLASMTLSIEGVRPPVLSAQTRDHLRELLMFRYFFRHAYTVRLDPERLAALRRHATAVLPLLTADVARLDAFLGEMSAGNFGSV